MTRRIRPFLAQVMSFGVVLAVAGAAWLAAPTPRALALIHTAPIVIPGHRIRVATHYPIDLYRLFKTDENGKAVVIPFQIDEINTLGDFVLPDGGNITKHTGNGIFDLQDELSFMGDDVGKAEPPTTWEVAKPPLLFEIKSELKALANPHGPQTGAVYLGVYFQSPPPLSPRNYVNFNRATAEVLTSRYRYGFDTKNWLVSRRVEMVRGSEKNPEFVSLLDSTTFFMRADLKYFVTIEANHRSIESRLEAYKSGPIRSIIRISFHYTFLKLNFELDMYTEISFFSNAVYLPAIMYNPLDGRKNLNAGSGFYYGMAMRDNPAAYKIETNIPPYREQGLLDVLRRGKAESRYWISAKGSDRMLYMDIAPSPQMRQAGAIPQLYQEQVPASAINERNKNAPSGLGRSPVNMALYFDMTRFTEGEHNMAFRLFFENVADDKRLVTFRNLGLWNYSAQRVKP